PRTPRVPIGLGAGASWMAVPVARGATVPRRRRPRLAAISARAALSPRASAMGWRNAPWRRTEPTVIQSVGRDPSRRGAWREPSSSERRYVPDHALLVPGPRLRSGLSGV